MSSIVCTNLLTLLSKILCSFRKDQKKLFNYHIFNHSHNTTSTMCKLHTTYHVYYVYIHVYTTMCQLHNRSINATINTKLFFFAATYTLYHRFTTGTIRLICTDHVIDTRILMYIIGVNYIRFVI